MNETKLKPCPFCGGKAEKRVSFPCDEDGMEMNMYIIGCKMCDIEFSRLWDEEKAIQQWNTRNSIENIVKGLEERKNFYENRFSQMSGTDRDVEDWGSIKSYEDAIQIVKRGGFNE